MNTRIVQRSILFADLRGSTALFEALGNTRATALVTHHMALASQVVAHHKGTVVKTLGDGVMASFENPMAAVNAAQSLHETLERFATSPAFQGEEGTHAPALRLQVALSHGEVVEISGDCFGDAVNVAARLLDHAGDNETLVTSSLVEALPSAELARLRSLDRVRLRGRVEPVHVYLLEALHFGDTASTAYAEQLAPHDPDGISLSWRDTQRTFGPKSLPMVMGRSPELLYCIPDARVSRTHARLEWNGGSFVLTDLSYNGTFVRFANSAEVLNLRRSSCTLHGSGSFALAASPDDPTAPVLHFEVLQFEGADARRREALAETMPLPPSSVEATPGDERAGAQPPQPGGASAAPDDFSPTRI
jgi:adenylate cyclase